MDNTEIMENVEDTESSKNLETMELAPEPVQTVKVYIQTDTNSYVTAVNSSVHIRNTEGWIEIDEGTGDKYIHAQAQYFSNPLENMDRTHNYIYVDGAVRETTQEEKEAEFASFPSTPKVETTEEKVARLETENKELKEQQMEQDKMILEHDYTLLLMQEGITDIL